jgi:hypothetical protein
MPTDTGLAESELRLRVQQRIKEGRLPVALVTLVNSGANGGAHACGVCDKPVTRDKVEYDTNHLTFHHACYVIWQRECARRIRAERADLVEQR